MNARNRAGVTKLGCLTTLLLIVAIFYFGLPAAQAYWRYLEYKDAMKQEVRFRSDLPNAQLRVRLALIADSLGLPEEAGKVEITRENRVITIESEYAETIELPGTHRDIVFRPRAVGTY